jgi:hypothetical protein
MPLDGSHCTALQPLAVGQMFEKSDINSNRQPPFSVQVYAAQRLPPSAGRQSVPLGLASGTQCPVASQMPVSVSRQRFV